MTTDATSPDVLQAVRERYAEGARTRAPELCCPVDYDPTLLEVLPAEIRERDYGCGDPSRFVRPGDRVLDLGSGAGKICYLASQLVGAEGRVIGVDATDEMLALARAWQAEVGERIGWHNVEFRRGRIQDLTLDTELLASWLEAHPVRTLAGLEGLRAEEARLRAEQPLIPDGSIDIALSNCVLNLVDGRDKRQLFTEIARVLAPGGRCAISDIVSDEDVPLELQRDPELWSGCISGALREDRFVEAFAAAGLVGVEIESYQREPWAVVSGIEFRSLTVVAHKPQPGDGRDFREAVIYRGPFRAVVDEDGRSFERGRRAAVPRATYRRLSNRPYSEAFVPVPALIEVPAAEAREFGCGGPGERAPGETKRGATRADLAPGTGTGCCA